MALSDTEVEKQVSSEDIICLICRFVCVCEWGGGGGGGAWIEEVSRPC